MRSKLSRFFNEVAQVKKKVSRFMTGTASLLPPMPCFLSSRFFGKPQIQPKSLSKQWRPGALRR
jgi:hypothetical protein